MAVHFYVAFLVLNVSSIMNNACDTGRHSSLSFFRFLFFVLFDGWRSGLVSAALMRVCLFAELVFHILYLSGTVQVTNEVTRH